MCGIADDRRGEFADHRRDLVGVLDMHPVAPVVDDLHVDDRSETRTDGINQLFGHKRVGARRG